MRYPLADLLPLVRFTPEELEVVLRYQTDRLRTLRPSDNEIRQKLKVGGSEWARLKAEGLTALQAERLAVRAGFTPYEVWPEWRALEAS